MKKLIFKIFILLIFLGFFSNVSSSDTEFGDVGTSFIGAHGHTFTVEQEGSEVWLQCQNGASECLVNCGSNPPPPPPRRVLCECKDWSSERSDCESDKYGFVWEDVGECKKQKTCKQELIWTFVPKTGEKICRGSSCGSCNAGPCNPKGPEDSKEKVIETSTDCNVYCGEAVSYVFRANDSTWPVGTSFCINGNSSPSLVPFPVPGGRITWTCNGVSGGSKTCMATRPFKPNYTFCGDGIVQKPNSSGIMEICDDGNRINGDGCNNDCRTGIVASMCGDGIVQKPNSSGIIEECDDGNRINGDGCNNDCTKIVGTGVCGDGIVQKPNLALVMEECDDGNRINGDGCNNDCTNGFGDGICGDGIVQRPNSLGLIEMCDDGNRINGDGCDNNCETISIYKFCGDGIVQKPNSLGLIEYCDDGNKSNNDECNNYCTNTTGDGICGDGIVQKPNSLGLIEMCDDGNENNNDECNNSCTNGTGNLICGDGIVQRPNSLGLIEMCDDGNRINGDGCDNNCRTTSVFKYCGDGIVQKPNSMGLIEICDDGNNNNDSCNNYCTSTTGTGVCGDAIIQAPEECDDGNRINGDGCEIDCKVKEILKYCGDGIVQKPNSLGFNEKCDDGNRIDGDGCNNDCNSQEIFKYCGDGKLQKPNSLGIMEECDDGNNLSGDGCNAECKLGNQAICGDGIVQTPEECDDGNRVNNDECSNYCTKMNTSIPSGTSFSCDVSQIAYADGDQTITLYYEFSVPEGIEENRRVLDLGTPTDFIDLSNNHVDRVNNIGGSSLTFHPRSIIWNPNNGNPQKIAIADVSSVTPFVSCGNQVSFKLGTGQYVMLEVGYNFKKPFVGDIRGSNPNNRDVQITLGTKSTYTLMANKETPSLSFNVSDYKLSFSKNNVRYLGNNITLQETYLMPYLSGNRKFETRVNTSIGAIRLNNQPGIQLVLPEISYKLNGKNVRYYLSKYDHGNDKTPIDRLGNPFLGIKVIGGLQGDGKYEFTGQDKNISDLLLSDSRAQIRKNAYTYIKSMKNNQILNNVLYIEGNYTAKDLNSKLASVETLIIKDGNFIIDEDLNTGNKKLGIIILKDGYDISKDYVNGGNIFVKPNVQKINAIIYSDGGFISTNTNGKPYLSDSTERTNSLSKQLFMNGSLFTRNTIGGAIYKDGFYLLPGGVKSTIFDRAMIYDLNYIRRGNNNCILKPGTSECLYNEGFVIKYDPRVQTDPPKLFFK